MTAGLLMKPVPAPMLSLVIISNLLDSDGVSALPQVEIFFTMWKFSVKMLGAPGC